MKTIIAGSRSITKLHVIRDAVAASGFNISEVVSGGARGVDQLGERWARINGKPIKLFPAGWRDRDGCVDRRAGMLRNTRMCEYADAAICIWDGESPGTRHMIETARHYGLVVHVSMLSESGEVL